MSALRNLKDATDAIYAVEQPYALDYDWPIAPYPAPASVAAIVRKPRKRADRVVDMNGVVHKATDDTLETVIKTALVLPHSALEPLPQPLVLTTPVLPIDEPYTFALTSDDVNPNTRRRPVPTLEQVVAARAAMEQVDDQSGDTCPPDTERTYRDNAGNSYEV